MPMSVAEFRAARVRSCVPETSRRLRHRPYLIRRAGLRLDPAVARQKGAGTAYRVTSGVQDRVRGARSPQGTGTGSRYDPRDGASPSGGPGSRGFCHAGDQKLSTHLLTPGGAVGDASPFVGLRKEPRSMSKTRMPPRRRSRPPTPTPTGPVERGAALDLERRTSGSRSGRAAAALDPAPTGSRDARRAGGFQPFLPHRVQPVPVGAQAGRGQGTRAACSRQGRGVDVRSDSSEPPTGSPTGPRANHARTAHLAPEAGSGRVGAPVPHGPAGKPSSGGCPGAVTPILAGRTHPDSGDAQDALSSVPARERPKDEVLRGVRHAPHGQSEWSASAVRCGAHERPE
jgi:hypothetical protein